MIVHLIYFLLGGACGIVTLALVSALRQARRDEQEAR
jgi:hypothetical protein